MGETQANGQSERERERERGTKTDRHPNQHGEREREGGGGGRFTDVLAGRQRVRLRPHLALACHIKLMQNTQSLCCPVFAWVRVCVSDYQTRCWTLQQTKSTYCKTDGKILAGVFPFVVKCPAHSLWASFV